MHVPLFRLAHVGVDTLLCIGVYLVVYLLRFDGHIPPEEIRAFWLGLPLLVGLRLMANYAMGLYSHLWKYFGIYELFGLIRAVSLGSALFVGATYLLGLTGFPRSIFVFEAAFYLLALGGVRYSRRFSSEVTFFGVETQVRRALIVGAGDAGSMVALDMLRRRDLGFVPVGFIDDNPDKWRARIHGLRVFGGRDRLSDVIESREIDVVILAMPSVSRHVIRHYVEICQALPVALRIIPTTHQILSGEARVEQLRHIQIEDLLGRDPIRLDDAPLKHSLRGQRVVVSGAGGSIGSELCRQILSYEPEHLYILGHGENSIYLILQELGRERVTPLIADIRDQTQLKTIFQTIRPQQLFHAAAHKHVPLMEHQATEAFLNNVWGSHCLLEAALEAGVRRIVIISTDKAAEPSSIMGLSKYFAELLARRFQQRFPQALVSSVRFGNVIGSRGSVIPLFQKQIAQGGPVTLTEAEMTRYFMTIPEAVQLVLQASVLSHPAGNFILEMGEPIRILDLAQNMIQLSGYQQDEIEIRFTGARPGEKMHETLVWQDERLCPTDCPQILAAEAAPERLSAHLLLLEAILSHLQTGTFDAFFESQIRPLFPGLQLKEEQTIPQV